MEKVKNCFEATDAKPARSLGWGAGRSILSGSSRTEMKIIDTDEHGEVGNKQ